MTSNQLERAPQIGANMRSATSQHEQSTNGSAGAVLGPLWGASAIAATIQLHRSRRAAC
jgi:hypothetical protein